MNKIFVIGLSHTGTRSLIRGLNVLGIRSVHYPLDRKTYMQISTSDYNLRILKKYTAIGDIVVANSFRELDEIYPDSRFILTVRPVCDWLIAMKRMNERWSMIAHCNSLKQLYRIYGFSYRIFTYSGLKLMIKYIKTSRIQEFYRIKTYGAIAFQNIERLQYIYEEHYNSVNEYFIDRPEKLLTINLFEGQGWKEICGFLDLDIPSSTFPHIKGKSY